MLPVLFVLGLLVNVEGFFVFPKIEELILPAWADVGTPLFVTPLLEKGQYKDAQNLSRVKPDMGNITSYSGFFTIDKQCESNLFFWFFPAQKAEWKDAPLLLWLDGGPGYSSLFSTLISLAPFKYGEGIQKQEIPWNVENNLLIIDQPVGTGFSFTKNCYARNETVVGEDLYKALVQFYQLFPELVNNSFVICGLSYAGHYIPALGHTIHKHNPTAKVKINLAAMLIGNGLSDAETQLDYGDYFYHLGLIDDTARDIFKQNHIQLVQEVKNKNWKAANKITNLLRGALYNLYVGTEVNSLNYIHKPLEITKKIYRYTQSPEFRKALHIGSIKFNGYLTVYRYLRDDIVQSVKPWVEELLEFYPIIFYNGQLDLICGYPLTINFLRSLNWNGKEQYLSSNRTKWCMGTDLVGYYKGTHNLYDVLVRDAGHAVHVDQPLWAYTLVNSVISGTADNPLHALTSCN